MTAARAIYPRRRKELSLLVLAFIVGGAALALVQLAADHERVTNVLPFVVILVLAYVGAHITVRRLAPQADPLVLPIAAAINSLGLAAVYRLSPEGFGPTQVTWIVLGIALFIGTLFVVRDHRMLANYKYVLGFAGVALLLLPMTPLGRELRGARLWIGVGEFSFQPGELAKICLVIFFAGYLAERKELLAVASRKILAFRVPDLKHFGPLLVMWGISLAIMFFQTDMGSSLLFFSIFLVMLYIATARLIYVAFGGILFAAGATFGYQTFGHVQLRVQTWLNAFDPQLMQDESYQLVQSLFALATGGLFGTGLGRGRPDLIPEAHTDFIFSTLGEELGLLGTTAILICFMLLIARGFRVAMGSRDDFGQLLAAGLVASFALQTVIILAGVTRLLPLTGITLPFMSYGGSSLLSNFILIALLIRTSDHIASAPPPAATGEILIGGRG